MGQFGIGQSVTRFEDPRLMRGEGRFIEDVNLPGQAYMYLLRSPHAHARIRSIDTSSATVASGVVAVFTGADLARDNLGTMEMTLKRKRPTARMSRAHTRVSPTVPRPLKSATRRAGHRRDARPFRRRGRRSHRVDLSPCLGDVDRRA